MAISLPAAAVAKPRFMAEMCTPHSPSQASLPVERAISHPLFGCKLLGVQGTDPSLISSANLISIPISGGHLHRQDLSYQAPSH